MQHATSGELGKRALDVKVSNTIIIPPNSFITNVLIT